MPKFHIATGLHAAVLAFSAASLGATACAEDLTVATDSSFVPFEFKDGDTYIGFDMDLLAILAKDAGVTYKIQTMDFNGIVPAVQTKQVDAAIAGIVITDERKKVVDFSDGYYDSGFLLLVRADSDIKGTQDLAGKVMALKSGGAPVEWSKTNLPDTEVRQFPTLENAYLELQTGRIDAVMGDTPTILYYVKTAGAGKVKAVGEQILAAPYGIAFPKGSPLVEKFNAALKRAKDDGEYAKIYRKWFDADPK